MIKTLTAYTQEIDDAELAVQEILEQLNLKDNLRKNSVGILTCYGEFIDSGVYQALCEQLPFDVVGATTLGNTAQGGAGLMALCLSVLTSDEVAFSTGMTGSMAVEQQAPLTEMYEQAVRRLPGKPSLMISFLPLIFHVGGDRFVELLGEVSGNIPNFGTTSVDHTEDYRSAYVLHNGTYRRDGLAIALACGPMDPSFQVVSISEEKVIKQKAIITASAGNVLMEVNDMPILKYMESLGLSKDGKIDGANSIPFIVDFNDGTAPVARAIFALTPEGYAVCGGTMPVNSTLAIGSIDYDDVIRTTTKTLDDMLRQRKPGGLLMFSCVVRFLALGMDTLSEMQAIQRAVQERIPYQMAYSGGEVCPMMDADGKLVNRFHNDTLVVCAL